MTIHDTETVVERVDAGSGLLRGGCGGAVRSEATRSVASGMDQVVVQPGSGRSARTVFQPNRIMLRRHP